MSKRLDVLKAVKTLIEAAMPGVEVLGLDGDDAAPNRVDAAGVVIVRSGDPGEAEIDLSPLAYNWSHRIPVEVIVTKRPGFTNEEALDGLLTLIGAAIEADRSLGGLCEWLDAASPSTESVFTEGAEPPRGADLIVTAHYVTSSPTG